jgi:hypothetical protein
MEFPTILAACIGIALIVVTVIAAATVFRCESMIDVGRHGFRLVVRPLRKPPDK